ncbi:toprim domain-containing protein [Candidatus Pacearchaeota archaeon]|nr:toprim domain-containing protein [Candidatus Pacearchaeota archaeon]
MISVQVLKHEFQPYLHNLVIVEGKNDVAALVHLGFTRVYTIHETSVPLRERILHISREISKKDKVCILTDFDKKGKQLFDIIKTELQALGVKIDSTLRSILLKTGISHIEGLDAFLEKD